MIDLSVRLRLTGTAWLRLADTRLFRNWAPRLNVLLFDLLFLGSLTLLRPDLRPSPVAAFRRAALTVSSFCVVLTPIWLAAFARIVSFWWLLGG